MQGRDVARGSLIFRAGETKDPFSMGARLCRPDFTRTDMHIDNIVLAWADNDV